MHFRRVVVTALVLGAAVVSLAGCSKSTSVTSPTVLNSTPPAAPSNLVALYDTNLQSDYLIWTGSSSASVVAHQVWQYNADPAAGNAGVLVGTVANGTSYFNLPRAEQNAVQYYRMRATTVDGTPSAFSATIRAQRHGAPVQGTTDTGEDGAPVVERN